MHQATRITIDQEMQPVALTADQLKICLIALLAFDRQLENPETHFLAVRSAMAAAHEFDFCFDFDRLRDVDRFSDAGIGRCVDPIYAVYRDLVEQHLAVLSVSSNDDDYEAQAIIHQYQPREAFDHERG